MLFADSQQKDQTTRDQTEEDGGNARKRMVESSVGKGNAARRRPERS